MTRIGAHYLSIRTEVGAIAIARHAADAGLIGQPLGHDLLGVAQNLKYTPISEQSIHSSQSLDLTHFSEEQKWLKKFE
jgi:hypothetical protein